MQSSVHKRLLLLIFVIMASVVDSALRVRYIQQWSSRKLVARLPFEPSTDNNNVEDVQISEANEDFQIRNTDHLPDDNSDSSAYKNDHDEAISSYDVEPTGEQIPETEN